MRIVRLGRDEDNDYVINHPAVSGKHADIIEFDSGAMQYNDHSTNGTMIRGTFIHQTAFVVFPSDVIGLPGNINVPLSDILASDAKADTSKPDTDFGEVIERKGTTYSRSDEKSSPQRMFSDIFSFDGRIRRTEYWLTSFILGFIVVISELLMITESVALILLAMGILIATIWVGLACSVKRSHDIGNSGFFILIPFYGLWLCFANSTPGRNKYGNNPKGQ